MKFLITIFSLYLLILSCLPCGDVDECNTALQNPIIQTGDHQDHSHDQEACNPFCNCDCCGHIASPFFHPVKQIDAKPAMNSSLQMLYDSFFLSSDFFGNIWQPPKFV